MRGHHIVLSVMDEVIANTMGAVVPFASATNVVLSGCSAGGLATYLHTDYFLDNYVKPGVSFHSIPIR